MDFADSQNLPVELEKIACMGRMEISNGCPRRSIRATYHRDLRGEVTEWVCFSMTGPAELEAVRPHFRGVDQVAERPRGSFIAYNRESGEELAGRVF